MYIRSRHDAIEALAVILEEPNRATQIIELTMRIALCLDPAARSFLADCQAALIEGGLDALKKRRHDQLAALARATAAGRKKAEPYVVIDAPTREEAPDLYAIADSLLKEETPIVIPEKEKEKLPEFLPETMPDAVPLVGEAEPTPEPPKPPPPPEPEPAPEPQPEPEPEKPELVPSTARRKQIRIESTALSEEMLLDPLLEEVGMALDILRIVDIGFEVFPNVAKRPRWELGRQIQKNEDEIRALIVEAMQNREDAAKIDAIEKGLIERMNDDKPWWIDWDRSLREACRQACKTLSRFQPVHRSADNGTLLLEVVALYDEHIRALLDNITRSPADAVAFISTIRTRLDWLFTAEEGGST